MTYHVTFVDIMEAFKKGISDIYEATTRPYVKEPPPRPKNLVVPKEPPYKLSQPDYPHRSGQGWTLGDYKQALNALEKQVDELHERLELLEKTVNYDGPKPGDVINGTLIGYEVD